MNPADKVEKWKISKLIPYARNARTHSDEQVAQIAASIREWGWTTPVLVDEQGGIIAGHGRTLAAHKLEMTEVPVMVAKGWSDAKKRAYIIADNKLAQNADWDNEDVNMYVEWGRRGILFMTSPQLRLQQVVTQQNSGGLTDIYLELGTYTKSFYTVMYAPSCVKISEVGTTDRRIHHQVMWKYAVPKILDESHRKPRVLSRITSTVK